MPGVASTSSGSVGREVGSQPGTSPFTASTYACIASSGLNDSTDFHASHFARASAFHRLGLSRQKMIPTTWSSTYFCAASGWSDSAYLFVSTAPEMARLYQPYKFNLSSLDMTEDGSELIFWAASCRSQYIVISGTTGVRLRTCHGGLEEVMCTS